MSEHDANHAAQREAGDPTAPSPGTARAAQILLFVLSVIAGCTDVIGFLGLHGLFTSHITGNLVVLAAHVAVGAEAQIAEMLAVPVFMVMVGLTILLADGLEAIDVAVLPSLLLLQFLLLAGFLVLGVTIDPHADPNTAGSVVTGMVGVSAMAVQNALVQISFKSAPSTAVMTSNVTRLATDVGQVLRRGDPATVARARDRAVRTLPMIVGFVAGCGFGAACKITFGLWSLALPTGLALLAFAIGVAFDPAERQADAHGSTQSKRPGERR